ncbi:zinc finger CCCH domain-containing protein 63-like [Diospyros lotus]|uniref:zinc finger CCCH domain-containing protein 63-like n=1 Tax=Diospyros lotus TaxID=55363 RepID=UPI00225A548D|nr:zinc finger CCCH domain-containing protein 63-like [Diospyros lotus]
MATVAARVSERTQGSGFHRRQCRGGAANVICAFWLEGRCSRHPCKFLHAESESVAPPRPKQFQAPKSRTWKRTPDNSSTVKNSSALSSGEDGPKHINGTETVQDKVCQHWLSGKCVRGEDCKYLHSWSCGNGFSMFTKLEGHRKAVKGIALPSGSYKLYTGCKDKTIRVWDCNTGQCVQVVDLPGEVGSLISEGPWVFVGLEDAVKVWNTQTGNELTLLGPVGLVRALATTDDMLFAATQDGTILAWKFRSENEPPELIASLKGHNVISLAIGANKIYSGSMDNTIRVWDLNTLLCVQTLQGHTGAVMSVLCWDKYLLSCSLDESIKAWGSTEAGDIEMIYTHEEEHGVLGLCGLNDAEAKPILLCSCHDNYVRSYDLPTFTERGKLFAKREVRAIQIGPAGTGLFFTGDATGQITVWKMDADLKKETSSSS